jgi:hypothetical protein
LVTIEIRGSRNVSWVISYNALLVSQIGKFPCWGNPAIVSRAKVDVVKETVAREKGYALETAPNIPAVKGFRRCTAKPSIRAARKSFVEG